VRFEKEQEAQLKIRISGRKQNSLEQKRENVSGRKNFTSA